MKERNLRGALHCLEPGGSIQQCGVFRLGTPTATMPVYQNKFTLNPQDASCHAATTMRPRTSHLPGGVYSAATRCNLPAHVLAVAPSIGYLVHSGSTHLWKPLRSFPKKKLIHSHRPRYTTILRSGHSASSYAPRMRLLRPLVPRQRLAPESSVVLKQVVNVPDPVILLPGPCTLCTLARICRLADRGAVDAWYRIERCAHRHGLPRGEQMRRLAVH